MTKDNTDYGAVISTWAQDPFITHEDHTKCGQCWREHIRSEVARETLKTKASIDLEAFLGVMDESKKRWRETSLYRRVKELTSQGKTLEEVEKELSKEGIEI